MTGVEREEQAQVLARLRCDASILAADFGLALRSIGAERPQVKRRYGICYEDGSIRIRLRHATTRRLLRYSALVDTLCHELAHLRHFDHGPRFHALYRRILDHARRRGIYRPRRRAPQVAATSLVPEVSAPTPAEQGYVVQRRSTPPLRVQSSFRQLELFPSSAVPATRMTGRL